VRRKFYSMIYIPPYIVAFIYSTFRHILVNLMDFHHRKMYYFILWHRKLLFDAIRRIKHRKYLVFMRQLYMMDQQIH
jgi:lysophospholipid acyltransferase (LPLAT)-like uncharacterized protein